MTTASPSAAAPGKAAAGGQAAAQSRRPQDPIPGDPRFHPRAHRGPCDACGQRRLQPEVRRDARPGERIRLRQDDSRVPARRGGTGGHVNAPRARVRGASSSSRVEVRTGRERSPLRTRGCAVASGIACGVRRLGDWIDAASQNAAIPPYSVRLGIGRAVEVRRRHLHGVALFLKRVRRQQEWDSLAKREPVMAGPCGTG